MAASSKRKRRGYVDIRGFEVMARTCATCPFVTDSIGPESTARYLDSLVSFKAQHLCHTVNDTKICRGGRDIMLRAMCALGLISEPTDECFERTSKEVLGGVQEAVQNDAVRQANLRKRKPAAGPD